MLVLFLHWNILLFGDASHWCCQHSETSLRQSAGVSTRQQRLPSDAE